MTTGQKKDIMLNALEFNGKPFTELYKKLIDKDEEEGKIDHLMNEMINDGLIKYEDKNGTPREWCFMILNIKGLKVKEAGGWLKVKYQTMSDEGKVHRLLDYVIKTEPNRFGWTASELMPAFENSLNEHEIRHICQQLIDNDDARDLTTKDGFEVGMIDKSKSAFYGKKYSKGKQTAQVSPTHQTITIGTIQQVIDSTVQGGLTQSADRVEKSVTTNSVDSKQSSTFEKLLIYVVAPIVVLLIGGIVLNNCFGIAP